MAKKRLSAAERKAFKSGMAAQYNKEHPQYHYAVATKFTKYHSDGSKSYDYYGKPKLFVTKSSAQKFLSAENSHMKNQNARVLKSVKAKNVDVNSGRNLVCVSKMKKIKPTRNPNKVFVF